MRKRALGGTGYEVSEIGLGAWAIGGSSYGDVDDARAAAVLEAYFDEGGNFVDTARSYGESERRIGAALRRFGNRDDIVIATKIRQTGSREEMHLIRDDVETSLRNLGIDSVDLCYIHNPPEDPDLMDLVIAEFEELKKEGKIGAIGASIKGPDVSHETADLCRRYVDTGRIEVIQLIYSIFRQSNRESIRYAGERDVGIVARTVLENGFLTGKYNPNQPRIDGSHRRRWSGNHLKRLLEEVLELQEWAISPPFHSLAQVALGFALAEEGVSSLVVGAKNRYQVVGNTEVAELPPIDREILERICENYANFTEYANTGGE